MSFSNINAPIPSSHGLEPSTHDGSKNKQQKSNIHALSSHSSGHLHITHIPKSVITSCIVRAFLNFSSITSFSKTSLFGRNIVRETMNQWRSEELTLTTWQIRCLWQYSKMQTTQSHLQEEILNKSIKDVWHLDLHKPHFNSTKYDNEMEYISCHLPSYIHLQVLNLQFSQNITDTLLINIKTCQNLRSINLNYPQNAFTEDKIIAIIQSCELLHTVKLAKCHITDTTLKTLVEHTSHLTCLNISSNPRFSFSALKTLLEKRTCLTSLNVHDNENLGIEEDEINAIDNSEQKDEEKKHTFFDSLTQILPNMRSLNLRYIPLNHEASNSIPRIFPNLTKLNIYAAHLEADSICNLIRQLPLLSNISYYAKRYEEQIITTLIEYCPNLQNISLFQSKLTDDSLSILTKKCPNLRKINLCWSAGITKEGLFQLAVYSQSLTHLNISKIPPRQIQGSDILTFVQQCPNLVFLCIDSNHSNKNFINELLEAKPYLRIKFE